MPSLDTLLMIAIAAPLVAAALMLLFSWMPRALVDLLAAVAFTLPVPIALILAAAFDPTSARAFEGFDFFSVTDTGLGAVGIHLTLGLNGISLPLFILASVVGLAAGWYALAQTVERRRLYLALLLLMQGGLLGTFSSVDVFFFYFFHELALIPTFILIGIWGGAGRRAAAMKLTIYLTLGALLSLVGLIALYVQASGNGGQADFSLIILRDYLAGQPLPETVQENIFALLLFGFGILVSLFPFHSWAPDGYAAAPTPNAMLHAGVLKKFGLYGLVQIGAPLLPSGLVEWAPFLVWLALGNILIIGLITMAQRDLKQMLGYSSVMHMGYCFLGIATFSTIGAGGAVLLMFAHGLSVALLFLLAQCIHERAGSMDMMEMGGLAKHAPLLAVLFVAATMASIGLPGFANFWGEFTIFIALWQYEPWVMAAAALGIVISAIYGLRAAARIFFGPETDKMVEVLEEKPAGDLKAKEMIPALILVAALIYVGFWPRSFSDSLNNEIIAQYPEPVPPDPLAGETATAAATLALTAADPAEAVPDEKAEVSQ